MNRAALFVAGGIPRCRLSPETFITARRPLGITNVFDGGDRADRFSAQRGASRNRKFISAKKMLRRCRLLVLLHNEKEPKAISVARLLSSDRSLAIRLESKGMFFTSSIWNSSELVGKVRRSVLLNFLNRVLLLFSEFYKNKVSFGRRNVAYTILNYVVKHFICSHLVPPSVLGW